MLSPKFNLFENARNKFSDRQTALNYILGGKGVVTLLSPSGVHHTYGIWKPRKDPFPDDVLFMYVRNSGRWKYLGMLEGTKFRNTSASRFSYTTPEYKGAKYMMNMVTSDNIFNTTKMELYHDGVCSICGKRLAAPRCIITGIGPKCLKKMLNVQIPNIND